MLRVKYLFRTVYTLFFAIVLLCLFSCGGKSVPSDAGVSDTVAADSVDRGLYSRCHMSGTAK